MAIWLLRHTPAWRNHPHAATLADDLIRAVQRAQRAIDRPPARAYAGPCPTCSTDLVYRPGLTTITCRGCGTTYNTAELQAALRDQLEDLLGTAVWVAGISGIFGPPLKDTTIRKWVERGKLLQRPGGLLRLGDVLDVAHDQRVRLAQRG